MAPKSSCFSLNSFSIFSIYSFASCMASLFGANRLNEPSSCAVTCETKIMHNRNRFEYCMSKAITIVLLELRFRPIFSSNLFLQLRLVFLVCKRLLPAFQKQANFLSSLFYNNSTNRHRSLMYSTIVHILLYLGTEMTLFMISIIAA